jgi:serine/threonine-protein kinase
MPVSFGPYVLERWLAQGGMANVFVATYGGPLGFEREVALKVILPEYAHHHAFISMFLDEARLAARLTHPNIVQVHDLGQFQGYFFIAMEYVAGSSLSAAMSRARAEHRRMHPGLALSIVSGVLEALSYAHQRRDRSGAPLGIVHRDVNPQNILLGFDGQVKLADFGVARANVNLHKTRTGVVKGKYSHMAPEQCLGQKIDERADLFAAGIVLHELLTGRPLFVRPSLYGMMKAVLEDPILPPSQLNPDCPCELDGLVLRALARDPAKRFQSAQAFLEALNLVARRLHLLEDRTELRSFMEAVFRRGRNNLAGHEEPGVPVTADRISVILKGGGAVRARESSTADVLSLEPSRSDSFEPERTNAWGELELDRSRMWSPPRETSPAARSAGAFSAASSWDDLEIRDESDDLEIDDDDRDVPGADDPDDDALDLEDDDGDVPGIADRTRGLPGRVDRGRGALMSDRCALNPPGREPGGRTARGPDDRARDSPARASRSSVAGPSVRRAEEWDDLDVALREAWEDSAVTSREEWDAAVRVAGEGWDAMEEIRTDPGGPAARQRRRACVSGMVRSD